MSNVKPTRYIELIDDIKNHVFQWATDSDWKKLPRSVNVALTTLMNSLKVNEAVKSATGSDDDAEESIKADKKRFVALFKKKYVEYAKMEYEDPISPVVQVNMARAIERIKREGGNIPEYIEWFFNEFLSTEYNKGKWGSPPYVSTACQTFIVSQYLFNMKDTLRIRKDNISRESVKTMLLEIALPMQRRISDNSFNEKIVDYDNQKISASKFFELMKAFAKKHGDNECMEACNAMSEKIEECKKSGI